MSARAERVDCPTDVDLWRERFRASSLRSLIALSGFKQAAGFERALKRLGWKALKCTSSYLKLADVLEAGRGPAKVLRHLDAIDERVIDLLAAIPDHACSPKKVQRLKSNRRVTAILLRRQQWRLDRLGQLDTAAAAVFERDFVASVISEADGDTYAGLPLPSPPWPGNEHLTPLDTEAKMEVAGRLFRNCLGSRVSQVRMGFSYYYQLGEVGVVEMERVMTDAAHELRTPVAILQTRIESLSAGMDRTALTQDVTRLALLCEQLLDLQRINQGVGQRTAVDLGQLARQCAADLAPLAISANREIGLELIGSSVVAGDGPALGRALSNLIMNALQHGDGPITVTVKGGTMSVADEGQGIRPEARRKVFEPFHRLKPRSTGSGLGLALVKEIAQLHGGTVSIGEGPRGGADVSIHLPLAVRQTTA